MPRLILWVLLGAWVGLPAVSVPSRACTLLTLRDASTVLMGNNEDWVEPGTIWFVPPKRGRLGRVNVGFRDDFAQGGMNERGLSFDAAVVAELPWQPDPERPLSKNLIEKIMNECGTVEEALDYFRRYDTRHLARSQFLFADATGDSAVVSWRPDAGLVVERIEGAHQVATNYRRTSGYRCARHVRVERVLAERDEVSLDAVVAALEAVHQHGPDAYTTYSTVYDLKARAVYVYDAARFDRMVRFDLDAELALGRRTVHRIADLFDGPSNEARLRAQPQRFEFGTRVSLPAEVLDRYVGFYAPAPDVRVRVSREGDGLRVDNPGQPGALLFPESEASFRIAPDRGLVTFHRAEDGSVAGLTLHKQVDVFAARVDP